MKSMIKSCTTGALTAAALSFAMCSQASITGQWDFKAGNLSATLGSDLIYADGPTQAGTLFNTTANFGISAINGTSTNVMSFPQNTDQYGGYILSPGAGANGAGNNVNQYTVIMDVLYPSASSGKTRTLFANFNPNTGQQTGEFIINASGQLAVVGGAAGGSVTPDVWHRVAITVDTTDTSTGINLYLDGAVVATQGGGGRDNANYSLPNYVILFDDANTNSQKGYVASIQFQDVAQPAGFISALGAPTATGILTGPPPNPYVVSVSPTDDLRFPARATVSPSPLLQIVLQDGVATVTTNTIVLKLNGSVVTPTVTYAAPTTTITYQVPGFLGSQTTNVVTLAYQDSAADNLGAQYSFIVAPYVPLPAGVVQNPTNVSNPGMIFRVAQAPSTASVGNSLVRALQQLDGTLLDTNGVPFGNEADLTQAGSQPDGSYFVDQFEGTSGTIAFDYQGSSFYQLPGLTTYHFPGIPGTNGSTLNFADDVITYLQLNAGSYVFGVDVGIGRVDDPPSPDDGYALYCGANPRDLFSTLVGQFSRTGSNFGDHQNTNTFNFVAPVSGVYPFRLVHWQVNGAADLGWYYVDPSTGDKVLINDPSGNINAFRTSTVAREPYVAEAYPAPGGSGFAATAPIQVVLSDDDLAVASGSIKLYLNGTQVPISSTSKSGKLTTIVYNPNANRTTVTNNVQLVYSDNATPTANVITQNWSFNIVVGAASVPAVTGQWDFNGGDLTATVGRNLQYLDGPSGTTANLTKFGSCSSFGLPPINGLDATVMKVPGGAGVNGNNNFGYIMDHQIGPNGGGTRVNQYTIIWDMYYQGGTLPFFNCQSTNNTTDGSLFLQGGAMGQGGGGYVMNHGGITTGWHRIAFAVDLSQQLITKWVDGVKAQDWVGSANALDTARRSWQPTVLLFADGDGDDHDATVYVNSIQVRNGKLTDVEMVALGGPSGSGIPQAIPASNVTGQWDFNFGNLSATVGHDLQFLDGPAGTTAGLTVFTNCSGAGLPLINGVDAKIMVVPGGAGVNGNGNFGYIMDHQISPNGGGTRVNQYTIIWDMYWPGGGGVIPFFNCQNTNNTTDGSLFLQGGAMGQGGGGYVMNHGNVTAGWHRIAFAVDLSQQLITKWVDGVKAQDWVGSANALDTARRSWQQTVLLFADGDGDDHTASIAVKSIQVSAGKMSDAQMVALGAPDGNAIPVAAPASNVTGQWDFNFGNLSATVGKDLAYLDGSAGTTAGLTTFSTCSAASLPLINGVDAPIMVVPGGAGVNGNSNFGYIMDHQISPNGGGTRVNQYTIIWDMYWPGGGGVIPFFNCQNTNNTTDGSLFLQGGAMGQGGGGYVMNHGNVTAGWHRIAFAADLSQQLITKWVDGVKAQDWVGSANALDTARRSWQHTVLLFADGDGDDHTASIAVKSIQVMAGKASDAYMQALGGPSATGIPVLVSPQALAVAPSLTIVNNGNGTVTVSWPLSVLGYGLESSTDLSSWTLVGGAVNNSVTVNVSGSATFFRLHQ